MQVKASIITIGDEILIGQVVDTNSAFIGSVAADNGIRIAEITSVQDNLEEIKRAIAEAFTRVDVVLVTGGLGPTKDDITKKALCELFGLGMYRDQKTYDNVKRLLGERRVEFNELNQCQADIPEGFTALDNPIGTAPGLYYNNNGKLLFCMAGVPFEMKRLFTEQVLPIIAENFELDEVVRHTVLIFGLPESELAKQIEEWEDSLGDDLSLAYLPNPGGIRLRLSSRVAGNPAEIKEKMATKFAELRLLIPKYYLGDEGVSVISEIARMLNESGKTLAVAESCSGGAISSCCTSLSGSSAWFKGGAVTYSNEAKHNILGVDNQLFESVGAVSAEVVESMARGAMKAFNTDYAIATSGIAGPTGATDGKELGDVYIAIAGDFGVKVFKRNFGQPRNIFVERLTSAALNYLRLELV